MNDDNNGQKNVQIKVDEIVVSIHVLCFHGIGVFAIVFFSRQFLSVNDSSSSMVTMLSALIFCQFIVISKKTTMI